MKGRAPWSRLVSGEGLRVVKPSDEMHEIDDRITTPGSAAARTVVRGAWLLSSSDWLEVVAPCTTWGGIMECAPAIKFSFVQVRNTLKSHARM